MKMKKKLPIDKTGLIRDLLNARGSVNLFTRPRRFGKSLNMDMLKTFFKIDTDPSLFDGLEISKETALCKQYLGKYPVISISLKLLTQLLCKYYEAPVIVFIDEYDIPLDKAYQNGYYPKMVTLIRSLFNHALKTNKSLYFAVITGCLRIARESIFTGLNHFKVLLVSDAECAEYFGFTDAEVRKMLEYYGVEKRFADIKEWYDGYHFGHTDVYCPWMSSINAINSEWQTMRKWNRIGKTVAAMPLFRICLRMPQKLQNQRLKH